MSRTCSLWLAASFTAAVLAVGIPYWQTPYARVSLPNTLMGAGLLVVVVGAALARAVGTCRFVATWLVMGLSVPVVVVGRVVVDTAVDPTSHNLWPFEVIIACVVGLLASLTGVVAGSIYRRLSRGAK
jgi:hypothetical protein